MRYLKRMKKTTEMKNSQQNIERLVKHEIHEFVKDWSSVQGGTIYEQIAEFRILWNVLK